MPPRTSDATRALLLAAIHPDGSSLPRVLAARAGEVDWEHLLERAAAHKIVALLASRLRGEELAALLPPAIAARLGETRAAAIQRNREAGSTLDRVAQAFTRAELPFLLIKGSVLGEHVYEEPEQRLFFDLDLVVRERDVDRAEAELARVGYELWGADRYVESVGARDADLALARRITRRSLRRHAHELPLVMADRSLLPIDLHWHVLPRGRLRVGAEELWGEARETTAAGHEVLSFSPEATLVHLAAHALSNRPWSFRLLHLCDFAWAAHRLPLDPTRLRALAVAWGAETDLLRAASLAERSLGVKLPPELGVDVSRLPGRARFERLVAPAELLDEIASPSPPAGWQRRRADLRWGLAMGTLWSTAILLVAKYSAVASFAVARR